MAFISGRKKENTFVRLLRQQAEKLQEGVNGLRLFVEENSEEGAITLERCEKEGDELRRILIDELHDTLVTPFDREDIYQLSLYLDDVLDYAYTTMLEIKLLDVQPDTHLTKMIKRVQEAADELLLAMERIDDNPKVALEHSRRAKHRENQVEQIYREAIADLFSGPEDIHHVMKMLRIREIYRHISNAADQADQAANVIGIVVMKMT